MERAWLGGAVPEPEGGAVVVGVGNPFYGDDGVGPLIARAVHARLNRHGGWDLLELCCAAFETVERLEGYRRAVLVDAVPSAGSPVGSLVRVKLPAPGAGLAPGSHTMGLATALELARAAGARLPEELSVYGIVIRPPERFCQALSPELERRLEKIVAAITRAEDRLTRPRRSSRSNPPQER